MGRIAAPITWVLLVALGQSASPAIGFISPISQHFCDTCNRVRMTAEGRLLLCLGHEHSLDLRGLLRRYPGADAPVLDAIHQALQRKPARHVFGSDEVQVLRFMNASGG
ncbi:Cyclic pyranopterin monophosphate synthase [compost metagenome]